MDRPLPAHGRRLLCSIVLAAEGDSPGIGAKKGTPQGKRGQGTGKGSGRKELGTSISSSHRVQQSFSEGNPLLQNWIPSWGASQTPTARGCKAI